MKPLRLAIFICALSLMVLLIVGCSASSEEAATSTTVPTAVTESSAGADPTPTQQIPRVSSEVPRMPVDELKERLDTGQDIVVVDNRSQAQYESMHIAGAIWAPTFDLESPIDDLALDQEIVLYCA